MRYGIELEYWTTDGDGALAPATDVAERLDFADLEAVRSLLEVKTSPCRSPAALRRELVDRVDRAVEAARAEGKRLVPLGTPLGPASPRFRSDRRTRIQRKVFGDDFRYAACAGAHLHVELVDAVDQVNALTALDPAVALVTTTAHFDGEPVAACARPLAYRRRLFRRAPDLGRLPRYVDSLDGWRRRSEEWYRTFRSLAERRGVDRGAVESAFDPATTVWSPVRLREDLGTVEWRAPDAALPSRLLRLVEDLHRHLFRPMARGRLDVVVGDDGYPTLDRDRGRLALPPFDRLRTVVDDALASGLASNRVRRYLRELGLDPDRYAGGPPAQGRPIDEATARRLRLRRADRLEADLRRQAVDAEPSVDEPPGTATTPTV